MYSRVITAFALAGILFSISSLSLSTRSLRMRLTVCEEAKQELQREANARASFTRTFGLIDAEVHAVYYGGAYGYCLCTDNPPCYVYGDGGPPMGARCSP